MTARRMLALGTSTAVIVACVAATVPACSQFWSCLGRLARAEVFSTSDIGAVPLLAAGVGIAWLTRLCYLVLRTRYLCGQLHSGTCPFALQQAVARTGATRVICIETETELAFCCGALRPAIYLSGGLVRRLRASELDAVLLHEKHHGRRRDPLRYAAAVALRDVCFSVPLLDWLARRQRENAELRADRAVMGILGPAPLAGALSSLGRSPSPAVVAAFHGTIELRAAQILGEEIPPRHPARVLWLVSAAGIVPLLATANCIVQLLSSR